MFNPETGGPNHEQDQEIINCPGGANLGYFLDTLEEAAITKRGKVKGRFNGQVFVVDYDLPDGGMKQRKEIYEQLGVPFPTKPTS